MLLMWKEARSSSGEAERTEPSSFGADPASPSFHADHESAELSSIAPLESVAHEEEESSDHDSESVLQSLNSADRTRGRACEIHAAAGNGAHTNKGQTRMDAERPRKQAGRSWTTSEITRRSLVTPKSLQD